LAQAILLAVLFFAPLAFGAVHKPAIVGLAALTTWAGVVSLRHATPGRTPPGRRLIGLLLALSALQLVPLPRGVLALLSPGSAGGSWSMVSVSPPATLVATAILATWGLAYLSSWQDLRGTWRQRAQSVVIAVAAVASVVGLLQSATGTTSIYGVWKPRYDWAVYGPYVNGHHFAAYLLMAGPLVAQRIVAAANDLRQTYARRRHRPWMALLESGGTSVVGYTALLVVCGTAFVDAGSRGAVVAALVATLVFAARHGRWRVAALLVTMAGVVALLQGRELSRSAYEARVPMWSDTLQLIPRFPLLGCGLEGFADAYRPVQRVWRSDFVHHAHNEYLQAWIELGPLGLAAVLAIVGGTLRAAWRHGPAGAGLSAALAGVAVYNLVDFTWHIPANAVTWIVLAGLAAQPPTNEKA
jgi:O-antigen ligase